MTISCVQKLLVRQCIGCTLGILSGLLVPLICMVICRQLMAAHRAAIACAKPWCQAGRVKHMLARHHLHPVVLNQLSPATQRAAADHNVAHGQASGMPKSEQVPLCRIMRGQMRLQKRCHAATNHDWCSMASWPFQSACKHRQ